MCVGNIYMVARLHIEVWVVVYDALQDGWREVNDNLFVGMAIVRKILYTMIARTEYEDSSLRDIAHLVVVVDA